MKQSSIVFILLLAISSMHAQYVSTLVTGSCPIQGIAVDDSGNVYYTERSACNVIKKITPSLTIQTIAQVGGDPTYLRIHRGYIYVSLYGGNKIVRVSLSDKSVQDYVTGCSAPHGLVFDGDTLFFAEYFSQKIYKVLPGGGSVGTANVLAVQGKTNGIVSGGVRACGLEILPNKNLVVTTYYGGGNFYEVNRYTGQATVLFTAASTDVGAIVRGVDGFYYYPGYYTHKIYKVNSRFTSSTVIAGTTVGSSDGDVMIASFNEPIGITVAQNGDIYVADYGSQKLRRISDIQPQTVDSVAVAMDGVFQFTNANLYIGLTGVTRSGICSIRVFRSFPANVSFTSTTPQYIAQYRILLSITGIQYTNAVLIIPANVLITAGYSTVATLKVYWRSTIGSGTFNEVTWSVNPLNQSELLVIVPGSGEFLFASTSPLTTSILDDCCNFLPQKVELHQNFPNPFNPSTTLTYSLQKSDHVLLRVYDLLGREVALLVNSFKEAGTYTVTFDASNLPSGLYIARLHVGQLQKQVKMLVVK
ncbi:MAG: T9SS type A sorting domain-containing protein [Bacteroidetes bacterium]|nr:T9SS type A sorting domain-containing protein [Bacteroidota bacterium]